MLVLACGACADGMIYSYLPFLPFLTVLFAIWCVLWGLSSSRRARDCGKRLAVSPGRYLLVTIIVWVLMFPVTMGSLLAPMVLILPLWLLSLFFRRPVVPEQTAAPSAAESLARDEATVRRVVLCLSVLLVPISYVFYLLPE
ncbi:MAG: hypothetical protein IH888_12005 [Planctomycetes bacterium]|nr:hypothetical protein [Planctomycetota bacterium]